MASDEMTKLIETAQNHGPKAEEAVGLLTTIGMPAIPAVLDALRDAWEDEVGLLPQVLLRVHDPELVPLLAEELDADNADLVQAAFTVLGQSNDDRAFDALVEYVKNSAYDATSRAMAADALGNLGRQKGADVLRDVLVEARQDFDEHDDSQPHLLVSAVVALAKLGDHSAAPAALDLLRAPFAPTRSLAAKALRYAVGPGMVQALADALEDEDEEVRLAAVDPLFLLGVPRAVDALIPALDSEYEDLANNVRVRLEDITGVELEDDESSEDFQEWWDEHRESFSENTCHRLGKPIRISEIVDALHEPWRRDEMVEEFRIITGVDLGFDIRISVEAQLHVYENAREWLAQNGHRFEAGRLYKYGHEQDLSELS